MRLLIDAGNSRVKWALLDNGYWKTGASGRAEFAAVLKDNMDSGVSPGSVHICSTRSQAFNQQLTVLIQDMFGIEAEFVWPQRRAYGVMNRYEPVDSLGADRWAALVAVKSICHNAAIIIDCGTAVTIDALNTDGVFEGGVIFPGVELALQSLNQADNLDVAGQGPTTVFARSSQQAMYSGVIYSLAGAINRIVLEMRKKLGLGVSIYICGGDAGKVFDLIDHNVIKEPDLVMTGLKVIAEAGT